MSIFTEEQIEAMAQCLRDIDSVYEIIHRYPEDTVEGVTVALEKHGIWINDDGTLAPWLAPPDDSVALNHPQGTGYLRLERGDSPRPGYNYRYAQDLGVQGFDTSGWHNTEEAARKAWNKICRMAAT